MLRKFFRWLLDGPQAPFVYEAASDAQRVRFEAPTLDGLVALMRETGSVDDPGEYEQVGDDRSTYSRADSLFKAARGE